MPIPNNMRQIQPNTTHTPTTTAAFCCKERVEMNKTLTTKTDRNEEKKVSKMQHKNQLK